MNPTITFALTPVDPVEDLDLIHAWVTEARAHFWGMTDKSRDEVGEVYTYLDSLDTHHAYLARVEGEPIAIVQTYQPQHDPMGEAYDVQPGDLGLHLFMGPGEQRPGTTGALLMFVASTLFADPSVLRLVGEPDHLNDKSVARADRFGATRGDVVDLGHKTAQLFFLDRAAFEAMCGGPVAAEPGR